MEGIDVEIMWARHLPHIGDNVECFLKLPKCKCIISRFGDVNWVTLRVVSTPTNPYVAATKNEQSPTNEQDTAKNVWISNRQLPKRDPQNIQRRPFNWKYFWKCLKCLKYLFKKQNSKITTHLCFWFIKEVPIGSPVKHSAYVYKRDLCACGFHLFRYRRNSIEI